MEVLNLVHSARRLLAADAPDSQYLEVVENHVELSWVGIAIFLHKLKRSVPQWLMDPVQLNQLYQRAMQIFRRRLLPRVDQQGGWTNCMPALRAYANLLQLVRRFMRRFM